MRTSNNWNASGGVVLASRREPRVKAWFRCAVPRHPETPCQYEYRSRAFTLVEVILSVALAVMLFGSMLGFYHYAASVRDTATGGIELVQSRRAIMNRITDDLRAATTYSGLDISLSDSTTEELVFLTTRLPTPGAFNEKKATDTPTPPQMDLYKVTYRLRKVEPEEEEEGAPAVEGEGAGEKVVIGVERGVQKIITQAVIEEVEGEPPPPEAEKKEPDIQWTLLSTEYRYLRFGYFDGKEMSEQRGMSDLPVAVELILGREPLPEGVEPVEHEAEHEVHRRQVYLFGSSRVPIELPTGEAAP